MLIFNQTQDIREQPSINPRWEKLIVCKIKRTQQKLKKLILDNSPLK